MQLEIDHNFARRADENVHVTLGKSCKEALGT